jgi:hypothetical protein
MWRSRIYRVKSDFVLQVSQRFVKYIEKQKQPRNQNQKRLNELTHEQKLNRPELNAMDSIQHHA